MTLSDLEWSSFLCLILFSSMQVMSLAYMLWLSEPRRQLCKVNKDAPLL